MSAPRQLCTAIVERFKTASISFRDEKAHIGRYSIDDIKRMHGAAPAVAVGIVNAGKPKPRASGQLQVDVAYAAVIVTRARSTSKADDHAIDLALAVAANLTAWVPATIVNGCQPATDIHMEPVADDKIDKAASSSGW